MTQAPESQHAGPPLAPGEVFAGKYVVERQIGAGGMGVVLAARHEQLGQTVAIKLLAVPPELRPEALRRFLTEAQAAARLRSEHVARVMDAGTDAEGRHYIIMEYLQGADLGGVLRNSGPLPVADAVGYVLQACEGIAEAHANGIVHRDLKPENLFVTRGIDGSPLVKVLDFGISKIMPSDLRPQLSVTPRGALMGSPLYMSPEQLRMASDVDVRSDVWGLGVILYELLTDRIPFSGPDLPGVVAAVLSAPPAPLESLRADLPAELAAAVARALSKDPAARFQNVGELARALEPWAPAWAFDSVGRASRTIGLPDSGPGRAADTRTPPPVAVPERRPAAGPRRGAILAVGGTAAAAVLIGVLTRGERTPSSAVTASGETVVAPARAAAPGPTPPTVVPVEVPRAGEQPPRAPAPPASPPVARRRAVASAATHAPPFKARKPKPTVDPLEGRK
jgi:serine/threonine-protein kinase